MAFYTNRPNKVEAWQLGSGAEKPDWLSDAVKNLVVTFSTDSMGLERAAVVTTQGSVLAVPYSYLVRSEIGEVYPCRADIFESSYDLYVAPVVTEAIATEQEVEPAPEESMVKETTTDEPAVEPALEEPMVEETTTDEPAVESAPEEPMVEETTTDEPAVEPALEEPMVEETVTEEPVTNEEMQ